MMRPHLGPLGLFCCLLFGILAQAKLVNVTVDDNSPSIFYSPEDGWQDSLVPCQGCTARPNSSRAIYGTWHDSTHYADVGSEVNTIPNASISFNGTAIYVMCILAQTTTSPTGNSDMSFYIDGNLVGQFIKAAPGESGFEYNVSVYSNSSIPPGQHSFTVQNGQIGGIKSLALLDAFVYSYDDGRSSDDDKSGSHTTTVTNSPHISAIIGFSVAGSLALVLGILTFILFRKRRRRRSMSNRDAAEVSGNIHRNQQTLQDIIPFLLNDHYTSSTNRYTVPSVNNSESRPTKITQNRGRIITPAPHRADSPERRDAPPSYY